MAPAVNSEVMEIIAEYARSGRRLESCSAEILGGMFAAAAALFAECPADPAVSEMSLAIYAEYVLRRLSPPVHLIQAELAQIRRFDMGAAAELPQPIAAHLKN